jgi:hypothetical protein
MKRARGWLRRRGWSLRGDAIREKAIDLWVFGEGDPRIWVEVNT